MSRSHRAAVTPRAEGIAHRSTAWSWETADGDDVPERLLRDWSTLASHPIAQPFVPLQCWKHFREDGWRFQVHSLYRNGNLVAVVPLAEGGRVFRRWRAPCHREIGRVNFAFTGDPEEVLGMILDRCLGPDGDVFEVPCVTADSPTYSGLRQAAEQRRLRYVEDLSAEIPVVNLTAGWDAFWRAISPRTRREFGRRERQMEKAGILEFHEVHSADVLEQVFSECLEIEASGYKGERGTALLQRETEREFWWSFITHAAAAGCLALYTLRLDGRLVSFDLCLKHNSVIFEMKHGTDVRLRPFSPGSVLHLKLFRREIEAGKCTLYDFAGEAYEWKTRWTKERKRMFGLRIYSPCLRGRAAFTVGPGIRRAIKRVPGTYGLVAAVRQLRRRYRDVARA